MKSNKLRVAIVFGGRSAEHEVSLRSAKNVVEALDTTKYDPVLIGIDREGRWFSWADSTYFLSDSEQNLLTTNSKNNKQVVLTPDGVDQSIIEKNTNISLSKIDVVFPVLHGPFGEDGSFQGLARLANLPCVGSDILGSAIGMDKDVMKRLLRDANINTPRFFAFSSPEDAIKSFDTVTSELGDDLFIKPANLGSSVGVTHSTTSKKYTEGVYKAFDFDTKIIVEETIKGREIEIAVLGNNNPVTSVAGEIVNNTDFYSYEAKYIDENGAALIIPAALPDHLKETLESIALRTYRVLCCRGMARVDFFIDEKEKIYVNEINTIPGFTSISMYPKLWEASGLSYQKLIDRLIELSIEEFNSKKMLKSTPG